MDSENCWAKTTDDGKPGISVRDHCLNVGCVAEAIIEFLPPSIKGLLPQGATTLAALHDVGKITLGFQVKCPAWLQKDGLPKVSLGEAALSVTDHALVSQVFIQKLINSTPVRLWAVAVGAHHGRPKGRIARLNPPHEALAEWAEENRLHLAEELQTVFGPLPTTPPDPCLAPHHSDLWLLAGLISIADWIGSNEMWFSPENGMPLDEARQRAHDAIREIGWPGGKLRQTSFSATFSAESPATFQPNSIQQVVAEAAQVPGIIIVEGPMGCGKTEAALFAAQQLISSGQQQGFYFALPTQVTSNRIHERIGHFLKNTLADTAAFRLAHANAWLEESFDLRLSPAFHRWEEKDGEKPEEHLQEARSWFASAKLALLAPYGVGTIDQALQAMVTVKHFFVRRFALAGKVVILDEIHSYDIYTGTLITALIRELVNLRCSVIVLSATLTGARRRELLNAAGITETQPSSAYPLVTAGATGEECRHVSPEWSSHRQITLRPAVISDEVTISELVARAETGQHVLWIRNTVIEAQDAFRQAASSVREDTVRLGLLHSRFPFTRRAELEADWLKHLGKNRPSDGPGSILIATQVVEQSVDIDLDFIVSDLAPTDMLLQRLGRLWRHERSHRHAATPEFWVRLPDLSSVATAGELKKALGRSSRVYAPYVLLRTLSVWNLKFQITLPDDIRPLLEDTYADSNPQEPETWQELHNELEKEKQTLAANAEAATRVLGNPMLDDKEEVLTRRKGSPTAPLLLLRSFETQLNGCVLLVAIDGSQTEISEHEWRKSSARFLHRWMVRVPRWMIPATTQKHQWLELHAPQRTGVALVRDNGRCIINNELSSVTYDPRLGIFAERSARPTPQCNDDDEFDS